MMKKQAGERWPVHIDKGTQPCHSEIAGPGHKDIMMCVAGRRLCLICLAVAAQRPPGQRHQKYLLVTKRCGSCACPKKG